MWSISALFNFTWNNERILKLYGKRLREEIASMLPHHDVAYEAKFTVTENNTTQLNETNPPAIKVFDFLIIFMFNKLILICIKHFSFVSKNSYEIIQDLSGPNV